MAARKTAVVDLTPTVAALLAVVDSVLDVVVDRTGRAAACRKTLTNMDPQTGTLTTQQMHINRIFRPWGVVMVAGVCL